MHEILGWDKVSLKDELEILTGYSFSSKQFNKEKGLPLIRIRDLLTHNPVTKYDGEFKDPYLINEGDILIGMDGEFNIVKWKGPNALLNQRVAKIKSKDSKIIDNLFIYYKMINELKKIEAITPATTVKHLAKKDIQNLNLILPPIEEQQKIASILSSVDEAIEKTEQIIKQTETVKKGIAQSVFKHELGNKLMKIEDITDIKTGGTPSRSKEEYWLNGNIKWMASGDIHQGHVHEVPGRITELGLSNSNTRMLPIGTVMIALNGQGKTRGTAAILQTELTCNQSLAGFLPNSTLNSYYLYYNLQARYNEIRNYTGEGTRTGLNLGILRNIEISVPSVEKQNEIVEILQSLDRKIQVENAQKQALLVVKKGLMQQLLTGKVRVPMNEEVPQ